MIRKLKSEQGSVIILVALMMVLFLAFVALVLDGGYLYLEKSRLQKVVDAAALAGAQELPEHSQQAENQVQTAIEQNGANPADFIIKFNQTFTVIEVVGKRKVTLFFAKSFGVKDPVIEASAAVQLMPLTSGWGSAPFGVEKSENLAYGDLKALKVGESLSGNFGALVLSGTGANDYENDLTYGYQGELKINRVLETQTGNIKGPTRRGAQARINECPTASFNSFPIDCGRVLLVPVYEPIFTDGNQIKQVKVVGFASFFLETVSGNGEEVTGRFIKITQQGMIAPGQANYGSYGFKLAK
jgi:hypothetical protein